MFSDHFYGFPSRATDAMTMPTPQDSKLDRIVAEARRNAEQRDQGYRVRALRCTRGSVAAARVSSPAPTCVS